MIVPKIVFLVAVIPLASAGGHGDRLIKDLLQDYVLEERPVLNDRDTLEVSHYEIRRTCFYIIRNILS